MMPLEVDDREAATALAGCVSLFVAQLPSPYRDAITLVELEGKTAKEAAEMVGLSVSGAMCAASRPTSRPDASLRARPYREPRALRRLGALSGAL